MKKPYLRKLLKHLRNLKRDFPLQHPVKVRTYKNYVDADGKTRLYGTTSFRNGVFVIELLRHRDPSIIVDTLWHEWAHALIWDEHDFSHGREFWQTYGKIYRKYQD